MKRIKAWFMKMGRLMPGISRRTGDVLLRIAPMLLPCGLLLTGWYMLEAMSSVYKWQEGAALLIELIGSVVLVPTVAGIVTYLTGARWEKRNVNQMDAFHLVRIKFKDILITGLAAGLIGMAVNWLGMMLYSLIQMVSVLLSWIPWIGAVIAGIVACTLWLISLAMEFIVHAALVMGMAALTADGVSGQTQLRQVLGVLRGGWSDATAGLAAIFGLWIVVKGVYEALIYLCPTGAVLAWCAVLAMLVLCSMTAVCVIYLMRRDRKNGTSYYA